jgi:hypothetical protein
MVRQIVVADPSRRLQLHAPTAEVEVMRCDRIDGKTPGRRGTRRSLRW